MLLNEFLLSQQTSYFFTRVKRTHEEDGVTRITLFVRLTEEQSWRFPAKMECKSKSVWADITEIAAHEAAENILAIPEHEYKFIVSKQVFQELAELAETAPAALFHTTPVYMAYAFSESS